MFSKLLRLAGVLIIASTLLVSAGQVFAAEAPGTGPEMAFTVPTGQVSIPAGGELWFAFNYAGDGSQITVDMAGNASLTTFTIWTPAEVQQRSTGASVTPVGAGSVLSYGNNPDQLWISNFNARGTFYVVVDERPTQSASFSLTVTGSGVTPAGTPMPSSASASATAAPAVAAASTPAPAAPAASTTVSSTVAAAATPAPAATAASATVTGTAVLTGTSPNNAFTPQGWITLAPGKTTWYSFQYPGGSSAGIGPQVTIDMFTYPSTAASYAVWTPQGIQAMLAGQSASPVGLGALNPNRANDIIWSGSFFTPGTYYVQVSQLQNGGYNLQITGSGVTF